MASTLTVTNSTNVIVIGDSSGATPNSSIHKSQIVRVGTYYAQNCYNGMGMSVYAYGWRTPGRTTKTIINLELQHGINVSFDCDDVTNQAGWQGGTIAALNQAESDINSWLP
jgi:hypothetical protein